MFWLLFLLVLGLSLADDSLQCNAVLFLKFPSEYLLGNVILQSNLIWYHFRMFCFWSRLFRIESCVMLEINIFQCCMLVYKIITALLVLQNSLPVAQKF